MREGMVPILVFLFAAITTQPARAAGDADAARGIVAEHCSACHEVPGYARRQGRADVNAPSFQSIADQPEVYTAVRLNAFLHQPHYPMKKFILSQTDIDNIIAFIRKLHME